MDREYTSRGEVSLEQYFDGDGNPAEADGVFGVRRVYNSYANLESETYLDREGNPAVNSQGYVSVCYDYDLSNAAQVERYYEYYLDINEEPCQAVNGAWGMMTVYYPVTSVHEVTFLDENKNPTVTEKGYAILEYEQDQAGNITWEGYYDAIGAQINSVDGYASVERGFDEERRLISERYLDRYNKLTNNKEGVAGWNGYYDEDGNLVIISRYDQDLKSVPAEP